MMGNSLFQVLYQSGFWFSVLDISAWLIVIGFSFASIIKGSDDVRKKAGFMHWCVFRGIHGFLIMLGAWFVLQLSLFDMPIFLYDLLRDVGLAILLMWRFIYKRSTNIWKKHETFIGLVE